MGSTRGWELTRHRWQVLRQVEAELAESPSAWLPWREEYAELFGDPDGLVAMLRYRLRLTGEAQLDLQLPENVLAEQRRLLAARTAGVRRLLAAYDAPGRTHVAA